MTPIRSLVLACSACLAAAVPARAQVSPEQVWAFWQGMMDGAGYAVSVEAERRDGPRLVLDGVVLTSDSATGTIEAPIGQVVLADRGDGSVEITIPETFDIAMSVAEPDAEPVEMVVTVAQQGYAVVVTGQPEAPVWTIRVDSLEVGISEPVVGEATMPMDIVVTLAGLTGTTALSAPPGAPVAMTYDFAVDGVELAMAADNPDGQGTFDMTLAAQALTSRFEAVVPAAMAPDAALGAALADGLRGSGGYATGPVTLSVDFADAERSLSMAGQMATTSVELGLDPAGLRYQVGATGLGLAASGSDIPLPQVSLSAAEWTTGFTMPLAATPDGPADFGLLLRLVDLAVPDDIWAMLDPGGTLPRDPATLVLDARGKARLFRDLTEIEDGSDDAPGQVEALTIEALQLRLGGAELTGRGDFTFDNTDMQTFPGMPRPIGAADLLLVGGNALLDKLVAAGLVPDDQMMGIRLALAMFARPGTEPDTLTSRIEFTPDAQILANGQRIQ